MSGREKIQRAVISALLALVLWGWLQVQGETTRQAVAPLEFLAVPAGLAVADAGATEVSVTLRGLPSRMARVDSKDLKVVIDLSGAREGTTKFFLNEDRLVGLPAGLVLDGISPYSVAVRLEPLAEKDVPVRAASEGEVDPDYVLDGITIIPGQIRFRGPRSKVGLMAEAATAKISLEGLSASETRAVALAGDPKFLAFVEPSIGAGVGIERHDHRNDVLPDDHLERLAVLEAENDAPVRPNSPRPPPVVGRPRP